MRKAVILVTGVILFLSVAAFAQENRSEISLQGTGLFTKDTSGNGNSYSATESGGFLGTYRYHLNHWLSAEAAYGYSLDTQKYSSAGCISHPVPYSPANRRNDSQSSFTSQFSNQPLCYRRWRSSLIQSSGKSTRFALRSTVSGKTCVFLWSWSKLCNSETHFTADGVSRFPLLDARFRIRWAGDQFSDAYRYAIARNDLPLLKKIPFPQQASRESIQQRRSRR